MQMSYAEKPSTIASLDLKDQTSDTPVLANLTDLVEVLHGFLTTDDIISSEDSVESERWSSQLANYLTQVGAIRESLFWHYTQGVVLECSSEEARKLVEWVNTPLITRLLTSYASLCNRLYAKHKRYLRHGTNVGVLRQLMQEGVGLDSKTVQINVPEKDKDIVKLLLPLCKEASDSILWQKQVRQVFKSNGLEPFLTTAAYCTSYKDGSTAYSTKLLESLLRSNQGWLAEELESEKSC